MIAAPPIFEEGDVHVADLFCGALAEAHLLGRFDAHIEHAMAGRTEHPEHVALVFVHRPPRAISPVFGLVGALQNARLAACWRFAGCGQIGNAVPVRTARALVRTIFEERARPVTMVEAAG